ncbi:MAG: hypothetical protein GY750_09085 [Lentisphaerae bacterium]|nr:hypothetical protein [Lentisphaerota bacterium]MCP4101565.1 hypothetical protein [Lentisphaerota bacterium]
MKSLFYLLICCTAFIVFAVDTTSQITLKDGRVLKNPYVLSKNPSGINVGHDGGVIFIKFADMKPETAKKFGYNPQKAKAYEKDITQKQQQYKKKQEKLAKQKQQDSDTIFLKPPPLNPREPSQFTLMRQEVNRLQGHIAKLESEKRKLSYTTISNPKAPSGGYYYTYRGGYYKPTKKETYTKQQSKNFLDKRRVLREIDYDINKSKARLNRIRNDIKRFYARGGKLKKPRY